MAPLSGESPPIPSYDEATSASNPLLGSPTTVATADRNYKPPHVRSARGSEDSLYNPDLDDDQLTELESEPDSEHQGVDDLDYQGVELDELGTGSRRRGANRQRRRGTKNGWKERFSDLRKRVGQWKLWRFNIKWPSRLPQISISLPGDWSNSGAVMARLFGLLTLFILGYAFFTIAIFPAAQNELAAMFDLESVRQFAQSSVDQEQIKEYLEHVTRFDHVAGTTGSFYLAEWMKGLFKDAGLDEVDIEEYQVYLNYPTREGRRVEILSPDDKKFVAKLDEPSAYPDQNLIGRANSYTFHGLSKSGTAQGPLMYFNYGSENDYDEVCSKRHLNCTGAIAIVRDYGFPRDAGMKVKNAEKWGIKGVLIYPDPQDTGQGPSNPAESVQRNSVSLRNRILGDVLTPGWSSKPGVKNDAKGNSIGLVGIPSLPLSLNDAKPLLEALNGHGQQVSSSWHGDIPFINWFTGDQTSPIVLLKNEQDEREKERIFNVMGKINGAEPNGKTVIIGNHRDSFCFGASDSGSGTAVMLEVIRIIGQLRAQGWRPLRNIIFASWDAQEYNNIGSTEFVEAKLDEIRNSGVAYLNVGAGVAGTDFHASGSPLFERAISRIVDRVVDPTTNQTIRQLWEVKRNHVHGLTAESDHIAFQALAGSSSIDFGFRGGQVPYHSCYETYEWMTNFGDPNLQYHKVLAQIWVLLLLEVSQDYLLPFGLFDYVETMSRHLSQLKKDATKAHAPLDFAPIDVSLEQLRKAASKREDWEMWWFAEVYGTGSLESNALAMLRQNHNNRISDFETDLLDIKGHDEQHAKGAAYGLVGREQFKHVVFAPSLKDGYESSWFPFVRDPMEMRDWKAAQEGIAKTARILGRAAERVGVTD